MTGVIKRLLCNADVRSRHQRRSVRSGPNGGEEMIKFALQSCRNHSDAVLSIGIGASSVALGFLLTRVIGRVLGTEAVGRYGILTQTGMFLAILCVGGLDLS